METQLVAALEAGLTEDPASLRQCSPLPLVELQRASALIGRELQSVATPGLLCHKELARASNSKAPY